MKLPISDNIIKYYLRNVYFITGHGYVGKSTMVKMLAERYDMVHCGENYHLDAFPESEWSRFKQPVMWFMPGKVGWEAWLNMSPEEHWQWVQAGSAECAEIEVMECVRRAAGGKKVIVDTNIPPDVLREISDYKHVAIMTGDPEATLANFNAWGDYKPPVDFDWEHTGFFTYKRTDYESDTREEVLGILAKHFGLE